MIFVKYMQAVIIRKRTNHNDSIVELSGHCHLRRIQRIIIKQRENRTPTHSNSIKRQHISRTTKHTLLCRANKNFIVFISHKCYYLYVKTTINNNAVT